MLTIYGTKLKSRILLGTSRYPSPEVMAQSIRAADADIITVSLRRETARSQGSRFLEIIAGLHRHLLPNTAGCRTAREAITTAEMARELLGTDWIKLEVIADESTLQPEVFGLVEAAEELTKRGFKVLPYTTEDLSVADRLVRAGCQVLMPWAAPIGTGRGVVNPTALKLMRETFPNMTLIVDAGLGAPSHAAQVMEMGFDGVLLNTAVATAQDPPRMAEAFAMAVWSGHTAFKAGLIEPNLHPVSSTPVIGRPFS
jgi:thiazole synthase